MKKWLKRIAWTLAGLVALLIVAGLVINLLGRRSLNRELAAWQAIGGKTEFADILPPEVPDDQNAAVLYRRALELAETLPEAVREAIGDGYHADPQALADAVAAHSEVLRLVHEGAQRPNCNWVAQPPAEVLDLIDTDGPIDARRTVNLLRAEAIVAARDGNPTACLEAIQDAFTVADRISERPLLIHFLVRTATDMSILITTEHVLDSHDLPGEPLLAMLEKRDHPQHAQQSLINECTFAIALAGDLRARQSWDVRLLLGVRGWLEGDTAWTVRLYRHLVTELNKTYYSRVPLGSDLDPPWWALYSRLVLPTMALVDTRCATATAHIRLARLALRLRSHKAEHGRYPQSLDGWEDVPVDPFNGEPLQYEPRDDGFRLWSVGTIGDGDPIDFEVNR